MVKPMNILLISDVYFPRVNGVSTSIRTFTNQLQKMGHSVHLIAPDYGVMTEDEAWITRVPARAIYFDPEDKLMKYGEVLKLNAKLKVMRFDMLHIHTPFIAHYAGLKLAKTLKIPAVETYHTFFEDYLHHYLPWIPQFAARGLARLISKKQCNQVDAIVAPSQPMLDVLRGYGVNSLAEVIATGLQAHSFSPADGNAFRVKHGIALDRPMMLYVGRVAHEKNIGFLLIVAKLLSDVMPDVLLVIAGEGPALSSLRNSVKEHSIENNVQFIGYLDRNTQLNSCYKAADVFVFSSKSETQGLVILEAMAQGTPVVAIAELGTASILIEGKGALISTENESEFVQKVHSVLINPQRRQQLSETALDYAQNKWSAEIQAERMLRYYMVVASMHQSQSKKPEVLSIQQN
jgi:glycosyltransferase involved in cell wall biosynthesis